METLTANLAGKVKRSSLHGKDYLIAPLTMIVPGVLPGSKGPLLYTEEELSRSPEAWNHVPITVGHPLDKGKPVSARSPEVLERQGIGFVFHAMMKDKLTAEGWFDIDKVKRLDPRILSALESGTPMELSTGLFTDNEPAHNGAEWKGISYVGIARNHRPDHLAVLPDEQGACGLKDGCGVLVNHLDLESLLPGDTVERMWQAEGQEATWKVTPAGPVVTNELCHRDIDAILSKALWERYGHKEGDPVEVSADTLRDSPFLVDVYDDYVVFQRQGKTWALGYEVDQDRNTVALEDDDPEEVTRLTEYVPVHHDGEHEGGETYNAFCPTGEGGGIDPSCGKGGSKGAGARSFNKSEVKVLAEAGRSSTGMVSITSAIGRKPHTGGSVESRDIRKRKAATKLTKEGYLEHVNTSTERETGRGQTTSFTTTTYRLTDKGRQALSSIQGGTEIRNTYKQPSRSIKMSSAKACKILKDGQVNGRPLTKRQRGLFGAICKRAKAPTSNELSGLSRIAYLLNVGVGVEVRDKSSEGATSPSVGVIANLLSPFSQEEISGIGEYTYRLSGIGSVANLIVNHLPGKHDQKSHARVKKAQEGVASATKRVAGATGTVAKAKAALAKAKASLKVERGGLLKAKKELKDAKAEEKAQSPRGKKAAEKAAAKPKVDVASEAADLKKFSEASLKGKTVGKGKHERFEPEISPEDFTKQLKGRLADLGRKLNKLQVIELSNQYSSSSLSASTTKKVALKRLEDIISGRRGAFTRVNV